MFPTKEGVCCSPQNPPLNPPMKGVVSPSQVNVMSVRRGYISCSVDEQKTSNANQTDELMRNLRF